MGITNTINRAELAAQHAITATILHGHSHIATDNLSSLHQFRKHLLYPSLPPRIRGYFEDTHANYANFLQLTKPCAPILSQISLKFCWQLVRRCCGQVSRNPSQCKSCRHGDAMRWHKW